MVQKTQTMVAPISDEKLFQLCKTYGARARFWRQKFIGLLPEVHKRRLFEKKGFSSIFEFAKKLAGLSEEQVRRVLSLGKKFEQTPILKAMLVNGGVSINKLVRVASIATPENEQLLAEQVKLLPKSALETLVRDEKIEQKSKDQDGFNETFFEDTSVPGHRSLNLDRDLKLLESFPEKLKEKLSQMLERGMDIGQILLEFLEKREKEIAQEKERIAEEIQTQQLEKIRKSQFVEQTKNVHDSKSKPGNSKPPSRYIPAKIRNIIQKEYGTKCSIPGCTKPAKVIHHTQRFALSQNNDPRYLAPLCQEHHHIAHTIDVKFQQVRQRVLR